MRHFLLSPLAIAALARGMGEAPSAAILVTSAGLSHGSTTGSLRTPRTAVSIAPVAVAADHHLAVTAGTVEQTCTAPHRALLPMRAGFQSNRETYFRVAVHCTVGARYRGDCGGRNRYRIFLNGSDDLTDSAQPVISLGLDFGLNTPSGSTQSPEQLFTALAGDSLRYSPTNRGFRPPPTTGFASNGTASDSSTRHWRPDTPPPPLRSSGSMVSPVKTASTAPTVSWAASSKPSTSCATCRMEICGNVIDAVS